VELVLAESFHSAAENDRIVQAIEVPSYRTFSSILPDSQGSAKRSTRPRSAPFRGSLLGMRG
jgi:hypothetical protein